MAIQRIAYQCEHKCTHKLLISKEAMERHENRCFRNPENKACVTCAHFEPARSVVHQVIDGYIDGYHVERSCSKGIDLSQKLQSKCESHLHWDDIE